MRIGLDFDNTIVCYDQLFHKVAVERGLIPPDLTVNKVVVRDYLRKVDREDQWTEMQGYVYGSRMDEALAYPDALETIRFLQNSGHTVFIVSHKTQYPFMGPKYDLHQAARAWIRNHLCQDGSTLLPDERMYFEVTKQEKIRRIGELGCNLFIDDLPEILLAAEFPESTKKILFDSEGNHSLELDHGIARYKDWVSIKDSIRSICHA